MQARKITIDQLKSLAYVRVKYIGATIRYTYQNDTRTSNEVYFYNRQWHDISHFDFFVAYRKHTSPDSNYTYLLADGATTEKIIDTFKKEIGSLEEQSTDSNKETILHYFLRHFTVLPEQQHYSVYGDDPFITLRSATKVPDNYPVQEASEYQTKNTRNFNEFFATIKPLNGRIAEEVLKPALDELKPNDQLKALLVRDSFDNTPLHFGASTPIGSGNFARLQVVLNVVRQFDEDKKRFLLDARNKNGLSILDNAAQNHNPQVFKAIKDAFGPELITESISTHEQTFFSSLISNIPTTIVTILDHLCPSDSELQKSSEEKEISISIPQQFLTTDPKTGKNFVHSVCRKLRDNPNTPPTDTQELILKVFSLLKDPNLSNEALVSTTSRGFNPLHYLCRSGKIDDFDFLNHISPSAVYRALSTKAHNGFTPLHYVCRYGNAPILESLLKKAPAAAYQLLKQHEGELAALSKKNTTALKFDSKVITDKLLSLRRKNPTLCNLIDLFDYLDKRRKSEDSDYTSRRDDFLNQLGGSFNALQKSDGSTFRFFANETFMVQSSCCFFQIPCKQRYYNHMHRLAHSAQSLKSETLNDFAAFLQLQGDNVLAKQILTQLKPEKAALPEDQSYHVPTGVPLSSSHASPGNDPPPAYSPSAPAIPASRSIRSN